MQHNYIDSTEEVNGLIVQVVDDPFSSSSDPRDNDNVATFLFFNHRRYELGDRHKLDSGEEAAFEHGSLKGLLKHIERNEGKVIGHTLVGMYDHSGITIYPIGSASEHSAFDPGGWDSGCLGLAYVTEKRWIELCGDSDPNKLVEAEEPLGYRTITAQVPAVRAAILGELEEYDSWLKGEVYGYVITKPCKDREEHASLEAIAACPHSEVVDSCWGFIGDTKYAHEEAMSYVNSKEGANV